MTLESWVPFSVCCSLARELSSAQMVMLGDKGKSTEYGKVGPYSGAWNRVSSSISWSSPLTELDNHELMGRNVAQTLFKNSVLLFVLNVLLINFHREKIS